MKQSESAEYSERVPAKGPQPKVPVSRRALPGRSKQDKHPPITRGDSFQHKDLIGNWSPR